MKSIVQKHKWLVLVVGLVILILFVFVVNRAFSKDGEREELRVDRPQDRQTKLNESLPDISEFAANPSDTFLVAADDFDLIERSHPFNGEGTACAHSGGHIHFTNKSAPYEVEILAPADGYVSFMIDCFTLIENDKMDIGVAFAQKNNVPITMIMSLEPFAGRVCEQNPNYFDDYLAVKLGDVVKKGDVLARFPKPDSGDSSAHIHFNLITNEAIDGRKEFCPNIFDSNVEKAFAGTYGEHTCGGKPFPPAGTFCYQPATGQDLTGL